ncbi:MAG: flippase-like domain-containing protein, partial [Candidatus Aminicenantes bacterium]|nr:flippase-like domain-containing protein [Candidatus Aminicenantes bacterium]
MKKRLARFGILFAITFVFLYFFFRSVEWKKVFEHIVEADPFLFILLVVLVPLHLVTRSIRWQFLLKHEKRDVKFFNRFAANAVGFLVTFLIPGRLGELVKPLYLAQKEGMKKGFVMGTVVVERIFDIFTMCFLLGLFIISRPLYASVFNLDDETYSKLFFWGLLALAFASVLLLASLCLYFFKERTIKVI